MDLTPAWSHSHQPVQGERGRVGGLAVWAEAARKKGNILFLYFFVYISVFFVFGWIYILATLDQPNWLHLHKKHYLQTVVTQTKSLANNTI